MVFPFCFTQGSGSISHHTHLAVLILVQHRPQSLACTWTFWITLVMLFSSSSSSSTLKLLPQLNKIFSNNTSSSSRCFFDSFFCVCMQRHFPQSSHCTVLSRNNLTLRLRFGCGSVAVRLRFGCGSVEVNS